jgi:protein-export membrane protein SecD/preprotein translocase SecF subunit
VVAGIVAGVIATKAQPRLGLDLRGGVSLILTAPEGTDEAILDRTISVLRNRVDSAGVAEPEISKEGRNHVLVQLPGTKDPERLLKLIGQTAQLQFRQVKQVVTQGDVAYEATKVSETDDPAAEVTLLGEDKKTKYVLAPVAVTGAGIGDASAVPNVDNPGWYVKVEFKGESRKAWQDFTGKLACEPLGQPSRNVAIILDHVVESAPEIAAEVQCNQGLTDTSITGAFSHEDAQDLAVVLKAGALPVKLEQSEVRTVSATLGKESLKAGLAAGALGLVLVMLYVLIYYRTLGLQTWLGLLVFSTIIYGLILTLGSLLGFSLTLSGIAGLIVSIGIATDSYIVFFERVKEEVHTGRTLRSSMDRGFKGAWRTLRTANTVTIMAAIVLYLLAVGPVRGFALALGMATTLDLMIFVLLTWPLAALLARSKFFAESRVLGMRRALEGKKGGNALARKIYRSEFAIDFIGRRKLWLALSGALVVISLVALLPGIRGLHFGIDFQGGSVFRVPVKADTTAAEIRDVASAAGQTGAVVQIVTDPSSRKTEAQVQTGAIANPDERAKVVEALAKGAGVTTAQVSVDAVGEKWGKDITNKAVRGLLIFLVLVILYMTWRLELKMALGGLAALFHDLIITAGIYAIVGFEVTPATVIALLTILGYSLYDTVVVFDKIRENVALPSNAKRSYADIADDSVNQTLMRSINTSLSTLLPVGSLLFVGSVLLGADTLKDLALALFIGIAAGTFSSVFVATPLLTIWKEREPRYASVRDKVLRAQAPAAAAGQPAKAGAAKAAPDGSGGRSGEGSRAGAGDDAAEPAAADDGGPGTGRRVSTQARPTTRVQQRKHVPRAKRKKGRR